MQLEEHNNPDEVRQRLAAGKYHSAHANIVREYLAAIDREVELDRIERAETRGERSVSLTEDAVEIAREANRISRENVLAAQSSAASARIQAHWAMIAAVIATVAAISAAKDDIIQVVKWLGF